MIKVPFRVFHPILLWFLVIVMMGFVSHVPCFLVPPPLRVPLFALTRRLVAEADALLGNMDFVLFLLLPGVAYLPPAILRTGRLSGHTSSF
jgi:hypothetical protein